MRRIFWTQTLICLIFAFWQSHRCDVANSGHFEFLGDLAKLAVTIADIDRFYWNLVICMPFDVALLLRNFVKILHCSWKLWKCIQRFTFSRTQCRYTAKTIKFYEYQISFRAVGRRCPLLAYLYSTERTTKTIDHWIIDPCCHVATVYNVCNGRRSETKTCSGQQSRHTV